MAQHEMAARDAPAKAKEHSTERPKDWVNVGQIERLASALTGGALAAYGMAKRNPAGIAMALLGGTILLRGATGHCLVYQAMGSSTAPEEEDVHLEDAIIVNQPRAVLFAFWREFANLPQFVPGLVSVVPVGDTQLHWIANTSGNRRITWDTEIIAEKKNALITWRTLPDSPVRHTASVRFTTLPHGGGTEVRMSVEYRAPGGQIAGKLSKILGKDPEQTLLEILQQFKQLAESGEVAATEEPG